MTGCAGIGSPPPPTTRPSVAHCACPVLWRLGFAVVPMDGSLFEGFSKLIWVENINGVLRGESEKKVYERTCNEFVTTTVNTSELKNTCRAQR